MVPPGIFCFIIFSESSKFYEIWSLFLKFIWVSYSDPYIFPKFELNFAVSALFHNQTLFFYMPSAEKMNISLPILDVFQSRRFRKKLIVFSNNTFPVQTGIIIISLYMGNLIYS